MEGSSRWPHEKVTNGRKVHNFRGPSSSFPPPLLCFRHPRLSWWNPNALLPCGQSLCSSTFSATIYALVSVAGIAACAFRGSKRGLIWCRGGSERAFFLLSAVRRGCLVGYEHISGLRVAFVFRLSIVYCHGGRVNSRTRNLQAVGEG